MYNNCAFSGRVIIVRYVTKPNNTNMHNIFLSVGERLIIHGYTKWGVLIRTHEARLRDPSVVFANTCRLGGGGSVRRSRYPAVEGVNCLARFAFFLLY